jgi:hypothetical protein
MMFSYLVEIYDAVVSYKRSQIVLELHDFKNFLAIRILFGRLFFQKEKYIQSMKGFNFKE